MRAEFTEAKDHFSRSISWKMVLAPGFCRIAPVLLARNIFLKYTEAMRHETLPCRSTHRLESVRDVAFGSGFAYFPAKICVHFLP